MAITDGDTWHIDIIISAIQTLSSWDTLQHQHKSNIQERKRTKMKWIGGLLTSLNLIEVTLGRFKWNEVAQQTKTENNGVTQHEFEL